MENGDLTNERLQYLLTQMQAGDHVARDELFRLMGSRLERLARRMLRDFPSVRRFDDTFDVLQNSILRLLRALDAVQPDSVRAFIGLAAEQIRRELLDLARRYRGPQAHIFNGTSTAGRSFDPADRREDPIETERWCQFHEVVEQLPAAEREVVGLVFYHDWTQARIAELFKVNERTVRRWWRSACLKLNGMLGGDLPSFQSR